jgi:hypothetical protein
MQTSDNKISRREGKKEDRLPVMEIIAPNGTVIRFYEHISIAEVKELIDSFMVERGFVPPRFNDELNK